MPPMVAPRKISREISRLADSGFMLAAWGN
jgi:hypothetical protein